MRVTTLTGAWALCALLTAACGDSTPSRIPTAPSAVAGRAGAAASTAPSAQAGVSTESGSPGEASTALGARNGNGNGGSGNGSPPTPAPPRAPAPPTNTTPPAPTAPTRLEIEGLITNINASARTIEVSGRRVIVLETARIRHGSVALPFSALRVGDRVHIRATAQGTRIEASDVKRQNPGDGDGDDEDDNGDDDHDDDDDDDDDDDITALPGVNVTVVDGVAAEAGPSTAAFRLTRKGDALLLAAPLTVTFVLSGTAVNGVDYQLLPATATFAAGQAVVDVVITPIADAAAEGPETVVLTVSDGSTYDVGMPASAIVTIAG